MTYRALWQIRIFLILTHNGHFSDRGGSEITETQAELESYALASAHACYLRFVVVAVEGRSPVGMSIMTGDAVDGRIVFRLTVAVDAPSHIEGYGDFQSVHRIDLSVALGAVEAPLDMRCVAEADMVGKVVDLDPFDGATLFPMLHQVLNGGTAGSDLAMAVHAGVDAWHGRMGAFAWADMTVAAGNFVDARVDFMAKGEGLFGGISFPRVKTGRKPDRADQNQHPGNGQVASFHKSNYSRNQ